ncbi:hypothetical protein [Hymenobacter sp. CRA2]|uniref:hypothetical protein n=1 Tax=Hymenobacter sp. CRA2 TaxID=1955620 RepID=UPI00098FD7C0|nr:hypothetical protein [Hymenobacter sp. CRA2]OON69367.1 hypothetical protein B0919_08765 [Hymenobacter sp. CRA2]
MHQIIKTSSFARAGTLLKVENNTLTYGQQSIPLHLVSGIRYGVEPIQLDMFYIGREYTLALRAGNETITIHLRMFFGLSKRYFQELFTRLIDSIWDETFVRLVNETIEQLLTGTEVKIGSCAVSKHGISCKKAFIPWAALAYEKKYNRLTINHQQDSDVWTNLYYVSDYNAQVLAAVLDWVFEQNGLIELQSEQ